MLSLIFTLTHPIPTPRRPGYFEKAPWINQMYTCKQELLELKHWWALFYFFLSKYTEHIRQLWSVNLFLALKI